MCRSLEILPQLLGVISSGSSSQKKPSLQMQTSNDKRCLFLHLGSFHSICPPEFPCSVCGTNYCKRRKYSKAWTLPCLVPGSCMDLSVRVELEKAPLNLTEWNTPEYSRTKARGMNQSKWNASLTNTINLAEPILWLQRSSDKEFP